MYHKEATLDIYFGRETYGTMDAKSLEVLVEDIRLLRPLGVREMGKVGHIALARALESASILAYPCNTETETYCISVVKAQAAGCIPATVDIGALRETVDPSLNLLRPIKENGDKREFIANIINLISKAKTGTIGKHRERMRKFAMERTWKRTTEVWILSFTGTVFTRKEDGSLGKKIVIPPR